MFSGLDVNCAADWVLKMKYYECCFWRWQGIERRVQSLFLRFGPLQIIAGHAVEVSGGYTKYVNSQERRHQKENYQKFPHKYPLKNLYGGAVFDRARHVGFGWLLRFIH